MKVRLDRTGQKFGKLTAISFSHVSKNKRAIWVFRCACGNTKEADPVNLRRNPNISCGCTRSMPNQLGAKRRKFRNYRNNSKHKGIPFNLSQSLFISLIEMPCHYCGYDLEFIGIDRVDNRYGYSIKNCVPCCKICNYAKRNVSQKEFLAWLKRVGPQKSD